MRIAIGSLLGLLVLTGCGSSGNGSSGSSSTTTAANSTGGSSGHSSSSGASTGTATSTSGSTHGASSGSSSAASSSSGGASTSTAASSSAAATGSSGASSGSSGAANQPGDILIADQWNNRVVEVNPDSGAIVWSFGDGKTDDAGNPVATPTSVISPNDTERLPNGYTLIAGSGAPPASAGGEPACVNANGCQDNRVIMVDLSGAIVWQYGQLGVAGAGANQLNVPVAMVMLPNGDVLITDQSNQRIIEVQPDAGNTIVWQYGVTGTAGPDAGLLNNPNSAERLANGDTLIADESNNRVIEVDTQGNLVWSYGSPLDTTALNSATFASRLPDGHTLISDGNNSRVIEVDDGGSILWSYDCSARPGSVAPPTLVSHAVRTAQGNTLIADQANNQVIEVSDGGAIVYSYGVIGAAGAGIGPGELNWPYSATVVGDYTGLTAP